MESLKSEALNAVTKLPETATIDDIMYRLYVIDKVRKGKEAMEHGKALSLENLKNEMESW